MENILIRKATLNDLGKLLDFEQSIINAERPFDKTLTENPISYYDLKVMILSDEAVIYVAEIDENIIGSGFVKIKVALPYLNHKKYAYLGFMFTDNNYRGLGVNAKIIEALKLWSFAKGLKEIRLTVYDDNISAIKAYEKVGFKKHIVEMRLK